MDFFKQVRHVPGNILDVIRKKHLFSRYFILTICLFISAVYFNLFLLPSKIVSGGTSGISIILEHFLGWDPSLVVLILSFSLLGLSFLFLGIEKTSGTVVASIVYPFFIRLTSGVGDFIKFDMSDMLLICIFIGIIGGITSGLTFKTGFSSGGLNILSQLLFKWFRISISKSNFCINAVVVAVGGLCFGWTNVMYAVIILYINSLMIDRVLLGVSKNKAFYIMTSLDQEVKEYVMKTLGHSVTIFDVKGGYLNHKDQILMAVVPTKEYFALTEGIKVIDPKAFFVVTDAYQVSGGRLTS